MATQRSRARSKPKSAQVTLNGRFPAGTKVVLVEVSDERVLRSQGGKTIERRKVDEDGHVQFTKNVTVGGRYFVVGHIGGVHTEVRVTGRSADNDNGVLAQPPVRPDVTTTGIGRQPVDSDSEPHGLRLAQEQVAGDVEQRSSTPTGTAHPVDPGERGPYPDQGEERFSDGSTQQRSDTPAGMATPIPDVPERQEDVPGDVQQRSSTPTGVATPLPPGPAVRAVQGIESAEAKALAGEPGQAEMRGVVPGESIASDGTPHVDKADQDKSTPDDQLSGPALKKRAQELDIKGRGSMSADQLRAAIRDAS